MRRFEEGLAFYIQNQLAGQPILTYQELYERATEVDNQLNAMGINVPKKAFYHAITHMG